MGNDLILLVVINWLIGIAGGVLCVCRLVKMSSDSTKLAIRWQWVLWLLFFSASGWSFLFGHSPTVTQCLLTSITLTALALGAPAWNGGLPVYARKRPA